MKKLLFVSLALATALATSPAAKADAVYAFSFSGTCSQGAAGCNNQYNPASPVSITGSGYFELTGSGSTLAITGGSFTINGQTATLITTTTPGVKAIGTDHYYDVKSLLTQPGHYGQDQLNKQNAAYFDNLLNPGTSPYLDSYGIAFMVDGAIYEIYAGSGASKGTLYWNEVVDGAWLIDPVLSTGNGQGGDPLVLTLNPTPEPSSLLLLGTGLLLMAGFLFRKAKPSMIQSS
jgi:hypothetical protein